MKNNNVLIKLENIIKKLKNENNIKDLQQLLELFYILNTNNSQWIIK